MKSRRVAFFSDSFHEVNGVALTSREFARFAKNGGYPFFCVHTGPATQHWAEAAFETFEVAHSSFTIGLERDLAFDLLFYRHREEVGRRLMEFRPDLVHVTGPSHIGMLGAILAYDLKVPLVASWHTNLHEFAARRLDRKLGWLPDAARRGVVRTAENFVLNRTIRFYRLAKLLFAPNPELVKMLEEQAGRPAYLMQRGIDTGLFTPQRRKRRDSEFVIGFVGRLSPEKNVRLLAELERRLRDSGVRDCRFLIVGDGSEKEWLGQNMERVTLPGVLKGEDLADAYASMDVFVFPSQTDTFGNVVLEAMASGVPAIVSAHGGPRFLVKTNHTGYIADSLEELSNALLDLRFHPAQHARMAHEARMAAMEFAWENVFQEVYRRYEDILAPESIRFHVEPSASLRTV